MEEKLNYKEAYEEEVKPTKKTAAERHKKEHYKTERCKVLLYNKRTKVLDINFMGYGIRIPHAEHIDSDYVTIKYRGEIGKPNFVCEL